MPPPQPREAPPPPAPDAAAGTPTARGAVRNAVAITGGQFGATLLRAAANVLLLGALSKTDYGVFTYAFAAVDVARTLSILGLDTVALRRAALEPHRAREIVATLTILRAALGGAAFVLAVVFALLVRADEPGGSLPLIAAALVILPASVGGPLRIVFQARQRMGRVMWVPALSGVVYLGLIAVLAGFDASVPAYLAAAAVAEVVGAVSVGIAARRELGPDPARRFGWDGALARRLVRDAVPLAYESWIVIAYSRAGVFLLDALLPEGRGPLAVADLGAAMRFVDPILVAAAAFSISVTPYVSRLTGQGGFAEFRAFYRKAVLRTLVLLLPLAAVAALAAPTAAEALLPQYLGGAHAFQWLVFAAVWMTLCQISTTCLVALGRFGLVALFATLNFFVYFALAIPLAPRLEAEGVAFATFAMELLNAVLQGMVVWSLLRRAERGH